MRRKLTYEELEEKVNQLEHKVDKLNQVEDALRDSEERFRLIADTSSPGGTLYLETENVTLGKTFVRPYGVTPGKYLKDP